MNDMSLRGMRIGSAPSPAQRFTELAPRTSHTYLCADGHTLNIPLAAEADAPAVWDCRCGRVALKTGMAPPEAKAIRPTRSHWDILLERRSLTELEVLLAERLAAMHGGRDDMSDEAIALSRPTMRDVSPRKSAQRKSA
jgi:hypothetical protein